MDLVTQPCLCRFELDTRRDRVNPEDRTADLVTGLASIRERISHARLLIGWVNIEVGQPIGQLRESTGQRSVRLAIGRCLSSPYTEIHRGRLIATESVFPCGDPYRLFPIGPSFIVVHHRCAHGADRTSMDACHAHWSGPRRLIQGSDLSGTSRIVTRRECCIRRVSLNWPSQFEAIWYAMTISTASRVRRNTRIRIDRITCDPRWGAMRRD